MAKRKTENHKVDLIHFQDKLQQAVENDDPEQIATAHAQLGFAYFQNSEMQEGEQHLNLAGDLSKRVEDPHTQAKIIGIVILAYKYSGQLIEAFVAAEAVMKLGIEHDNGELQADALSTQGQIQLEGGDSAKALNLFNQAKEIAEIMEDQRRLMNITAAIGQCNLEATDTDQAFEDFSTALILAQSLNDQGAETAFNGNLGALLSWQGKHKEAIAHFKNMLAYLADDGNVEIEIQTLRHLIKSYTQLEDFPHVSEHARRALNLAKPVNHPVVMELYSSLIFSLHREELDDEARQVTQEAIELAKANKDNESELNLMLSLGESYHISEMYAEALEVYQKSLNAAKRQNRELDAAFLTGRIGVSLAEQGELDQAIKYHQEAVTMAHKHNLSSLEGEQLSMLSLAYLDKDQHDQAKQYCTSSLEVYQAAGIDHGIEKAQALLEQIEAGAE